MDKLFLNSNLGMAGEMRRSGLDVVGEVPWGTHFCQFYQTRQDMLDVLVDYFRCGLEDNEYCMWVTSEPLGAEQARRALGQAVPDLDRRIRDGQIEILDYRQWYTAGGQFDADRVLRGWVQRERAALDRGYAGLRLTGNTFWLEKSDWKGFSDYEAAVDRAIESHRMIALCTYSVERCGAYEMIDVVRNHQFALIKQGGAWELIRSHRHRRTEEKTRRQNAVLEGINRIFGKVLSCETEEALGRTCLAVAEEVTESRFGFLGRLDVRGRLDDIAVSDLGWEACQVDAPTGHRTPPVGFAVHGVYGRVIQDGKGLFTNDVASHPDSIGLPPGHPPLSAFLGVPLVHDGTTIGMLGLGDREGGYRPEDLETAETLAPAIVQALLRWRAEAQIRSLAQFPEENPNPVLRAAGDGTLLYLNGPARAMLEGLGWREGLGLPEELLAPVRRVLSQGRNQECELVCRRGRAWSVALSPSADGERANLYARDVTVRKRAEDRARLLSEVTSQLLSSDRPQQIAESLCRKVMAHLDCHAFFNFLVDEEQGRLHLNACAGIPDEVARQIEWLDYGVAVSGCVARDTCPVVAENIQTTPDPRTDLVRSYGIRAYEKGLELVCDLPDELPDRVVGDSLRLRQVLMNLVGNAVKFTAKGEVVVEVAVQGQAAESVSLTFSVADTGIGISPEDQQRVFAPFTQADASTTRQYGGSGLGLAICHRIVTIMGDRISVEGTEGRGSTFRFTLALPIDRQPADPEAEALPEREAFRDLPVLVVAESATSRRIFEQTLGSWGMRPDVAADVPSALARIHQAAASGQAYRLILADAVPPGIDGFTLAEWLQNVPRLATATILLLSGVDRQNCPEQCRKTKAMCLEKPISRSALLGAVARAMGHRLQAVPPAADRKKAGRPAAAARALRVLLAEDTPANQKLVLHLLGNRGHAIEVAPNGREALELLERHDFDAVLMDVQMPEMDGFQATAAIRSLVDPAKARLPIIAMTAHALKGDAERCLAAGMDAYVSKPIQAAELTELVERLGSAHRAG